MKLGLLADIHEDVERLRTALDTFSPLGVDRVVVLGDVVGRGARIAETCRLLDEAQAVGVWGNHDFGLCVDVDLATREQYSTAVIDTLGRLRPRLEIDGCHFTHVEPWRNPEKCADLWYFDGPPDRPGNLTRIFGATTCRIAFAGHYHQWLLCRPDGIDAWQGERPVLLADGRYFVVVGALCEGRFATYDTELSELTPYNL